jgi:predicted TIM-barrel fold metal-dependent hydrolase
VAERRHRRIGQEAFWFLPTRNTLDRATAMMPRLMYERLDDLGLDFCVIYPTNGLGYYRVQPERLRRAICRAYNTFAADQFRPYGDRLIPAAIIPMFSPEEAIAELEYASTQLGLRVAMVGGLMRRPIPAVAQEHPDAAHVVEWYDVMGIDSEHDYDPVWEACRRLRIAPSFHNGARSIVLRNSPSNFCFNHIGHFASAGDAVAKALFLGGVTRRFPELRFAFLEGGVGWACQMFGDLTEHWERRNRKALENMDPRKLDRALLMSLAEKYGDPDVAEALRARDGWPDHDASLTGGVEDLDDFSACKITRKQDWIDLYAKPFYFGCEADDRANAWAFSRNNPFGSKLNALYSSDIGHFDVIDMRHPLPEAYELVDENFITKDNFRDFVFANAVHLWGTQNPKFFEGTAVAKEAAAELARTPEHVVVA